MQSSSNNNSSSGNGSSARRIAVPVLVKDGKPTGQPSATNATTAATGEDNSESNDCASSSSSSPHPTLDKAPLISSTDSLHSMLANDLNLNAALLDASNTSPTNPNKQMTFNDLSGVNPLYSMHHQHLSSYNSYCSPSQSTGYLPRYGYQL